MNLKQILLLFCLIVCNAVNAENFHKNDLSILVSSCDKYKVLWPGFFDALFKFWPSLNTKNKNIKLYLITNNEVYPSSRVISVQTTLSDGWSQNIKDALNKINTKYILYLQDDYFFSTPVNESRLKEIMETMRNHGKVGYTSLIADGYFLDTKFKWENNPYLKDSLFRSRKHKKYYITLQALLFDREKFLDLLGDEKSPWIFEKKAVNRAVLLPWDSWGLSANPPLDYFNMVNRGQLNLSSLKGAQALGLKNLPTEQIIDKYKIYPQNYPILYNFAFRNKTLLSFYVNTFKKIDTFYNRYKQ
ncbi:MAG: hypothetical protein KBC27_02645 [Rickettsiales bacterium]|nr:hypothetical protein [Rickettsiales bacterium]